MTLKADFLGLGAGFPSEPSLLVPHHPGSSRDSRTMCPLTLDATPATWERYIERVSAVMSSTLLFSGGVERLAADCAGKLRAAGSTTDGQSWAPRHAA